MQTLISILRGINVGGHNSIKMADLKTLYEELKCKDITTYIQSGNVVCGADGSVSAEQFSKKVEKRILEKFGFNVPVITRTVDEMEQVLAASPFINQPGVDAEKLHVTFLSESPQQSNIEAIKKYDYSPDKFIIAGKQVYLHCPVTYGNSKLSNTFFESKLKVTATTRNWRTINILVELAANK